MTKTYCDRCGKEEKGNLKWYEFELRSRMFGNLYGSGNDWMLCNSCLTDLEKFMKEKPN